MRNKITFQLTEDLPTDLKNVNPFIDRIYREILACACTEDDAVKIKLVLEEALSNAMRHGNALNPALKVSVRVQADKDKIALDVHDQGKGFDFQGLPDPTQKEYSERVSGRGVFLMRKFMDEVNFYDGGSGVRMLKRFQG